MIDQRIAQFMNREVLQGDPDTPLGDVIAEMESRVQSAYVVCEEGTPVGVISERDAISLLDNSLHGRSFETARAADVMTSPVHTLPENSTMGEVIQIMNQRRFRRVPIVDSENRLSGIVNLMDLQDAMNRALERRGRDLEVAVMARTAELQAANAKLAELSIRDSLTGLLNRRAMSEKLTELHSLSVRYGNPYSVILGDIDHFKSYNDTLGHPEGDTALKAIANVLERGMRRLDSVYRYGGEEFLVALPETESDGAALVASRLREAVETLALPHPESSTSDIVTLSLGYATVTKDTLRSLPLWEDVVEQADRALYRAKEGGRNRVAGPNERG